MHTSRAYHVYKTLNFEYKFNNMEDVSILYIELQLVASSWVGRVALGRKFSWSGGRAHGRLWELSSAQVATMSDVHLTCSKMRNKGNTSSSLSSLTGAWIVRELVVGRRVSCGMVSAPRRNSSRQSSRRLLTGWRASWRHRPASREIAARASFSSRDYMKQNMFDMCTVATTEQSSPLSSSSSCTRVNFNFNAPHHKIFTPHTDYKIYQTDR